jgi:hypothetical protein
MDWFMLLYIIYNTLSKMKLSRQNCVRYVACAGQRKSNDWLTLDRYQCTANAESDRVDLFCHCSRGLNILTEPIEGFIPCEIARTCFL